MKKFNKKKVTQQEERVFKITPAKDLKCMLLFDNGFPEGARIQFNDKSGEPDAFDIRYFDLDIIILSHDACLYEDQDGNKTLDYSPETLGYSVKKLKNGWSKLFRSKRPESYKYTLGTNASKVIKKKMLKAKSKAATKIKKKG